MSDRRQRQDEFIADIGGLRLDLLLARRYPQYSRSHIKEFISRGLVTVNGAAARADQKLKGEERIKVVFSEPSWNEGGDFESWVLHEDRDLLALHKPAGLLMHPLGSSWLNESRAALADAQPNLAGLLLKYRPALLKSGVARCGIVHRLDRQTSGVLLVAKTVLAQEALVGAFKERRIQKLYRAIVRGAPKNAASKVLAPVGRKPGHRRITVTPFGKTAETAFAVLKACGRAALVEAKPLTGRTHQIRAHLAFLGNPVMGDPEFDRPQELFPPRMMLHAYRIEFVHPRTGKPVAFTAEPPSDFKKFWALCRET